MLAEQADSPHFLVDQLVFDHWVVGYAQFVSEFALLVPIDLWGLALEAVVVLAVFAVFPADLFPLAQMALVGFLRFYAWDVVDDVSFLALVEVVYCGVDAGYVPDGKVLVADPADEQFAFFILVVVVGEFKAESTDGASVKQM